MKKLLFLLALGLHLTACDKTTDSGPAAVAAPFNQAFELRYQQAARLPAGTAPELTIAVTDLAYSFCPPNARCIAPDYVDPTLRITDARGQSQFLTLPVRPRRLYHPDWIDTASIRANGRRYVVYYTKWDVNKAATSPQQEHIAVSLRVTKPD